MQAIEARKNKGKNHKKWRIPEYFQWLSRFQQEQLKAYFQEIVFFNKQMNLTSRKTFEDMDLEHFGDCLEASRGLQWSKKGEKIYDFGSGNGFPGLVWSILHPQRKWVLVDRDTKKAEFLKHVIYKLKLFHVEQLCLDFKEIPEKSCFYGVSRAMTSFEGLLGTENIFKKRAEVYFMKGRSWKKEALDVKGWEISPFYTYQVPFTHKIGNIVRARRVSL